MRDSMGDVLAVKTKYLIQAAVIAAVYAALTLLLAPLSYGVLQVRVAEALTVLPCFTPAAVPGLFIGCVVANTISPMGIADLIFGSVASLIAAWLSYLLRSRPLLVPAPPVVINAVVIGILLYFVYGIPAPLPVCMAWVAGGQIAACYILGYPLLCCLKKYKKVFE